MTSKYAGRARAHEIGHRDMLLIACKAMRHELSVLRQCLTDDDGCPDGLNAHLPGIEDAIAQADRVLGK